MGRFLSGLSWSQPVAFKAHALGMGLDDVQALVESRDAVVEHLRLHHYAYSLDGVRVVVDSRSRRILSIESEHISAGSSIFDELGGWSLTVTARNNIHDLGDLLRGRDGFHFRSSFQSSFSLGCISILP